MCEIIVLHTTNTTDAFKNHSLVFPQTVFFLKPFNFVVKSTNHVKCETYYKSDTLKVNLLQ